MSELLSGVRVLEQDTGVAAAWCARQFAMWGAEVVALEPEGGWSFRAEPPLTAGEDGSQCSFLFDYVSLDKTLVEAPSTEVRTELLAWTDVLITDDAAIDLGALRRERPELVVACITPLGLDQPSDLTVRDLEALSGFLSLNGRPDEPPSPAPGHMLDFAVGTSAFVAAAALLYRARATGQGGIADVAVIESLAALLPFLRVQYTGEDMGRQGGTAEGVRLLPCRDGWVSLLLPVAAYREIYLDTLGVPGDELPPDVYAGPYEAVVARVAEILARYTANKTMEQVFRSLQDRKVVCGKVQTLGQVLRDQQLAARQAFTVLPTGAATPAGPVWIGGEPPRRPEPARIIHEFSPAPPRLHPNQLPAACIPPLQGVRVLDLTQAWMGPFASLLLAELGAEVIKVEGLNRPDIWRLTGQGNRLTDRRTSPLNRSHYFNSVNLGKKSVALDLTREEGRELFLDLLSDADVLMETYTPGVLGKLGLGREALRSRRPDLIIASFSGFGRSGPLSLEKANGASIEALAGWCDLNRDREGRPMAFGFYQADPLCGLQMASAVAAALIRRQRSSAGADVDGAMLDAATLYIGPELMAASVDAPPPALDRGPEAFRTLGEVLASPPPLRPEWFRTLDVQPLGRHRYNGPPWRVDAAGEATPPCRLGEHSRAILTGMLGLSEARYDQLVAAGVTGDLP